MRGRWWWLRLHVWQWLNAWQVSPGRRSLIPCCWFGLSVALPAAFALAGEQHAAAAMDWLLSFDMPLELLLAVQVGAAIVALASRPDTEGWIAPASSREVARRLLLLARLLRALRWPVALVLAAGLLSLGSPRAAAHLVEVLLFAGFAVLGGASLAWLLLSRRVATPGHEMSARFASRRGLPALSWVPLHETSRQFEPRRLALLGVPVLLLAPMGSAAQEVLRALAGWVVLLYISSWWRQALQAARAMHRWMPQAGHPARRLHWYLWRHVLLATLLGAAALWLGWRLTAVKPGITRP
jgi:hypothetical protein